MFISGSLFLFDFSLQDFHRAEKYSPPTFKKPQ